MAFWDQYPFYIVSGLVGLVLLIRISRIGRRPANYPPGPPTLPLLGNIHQVKRARLQDKGRVLTYATDALT
jgi:hypothetical protein